MPEPTGGEKSLPASPRKLQRQREQGNVPKSSDLNAAVALLAGLAALYGFGPAALRAMYAATEHYFGQAHAITVDAAAVRELAIRAMAYMAAGLGPFLIVMLVAGVAVNVVQFGFLFAPAALQPRLNRLNPIAGFQKFVSVRAFVEFVKSIAKLGVAAWVAYLVVMARWEEMLVYMNLSPLGLTRAIGSLTGAVWFWIGLAMLAIALLDLAFQRYQYFRDQRMTVQEAREELKEMEGDPRVRQRIRSIQRQMAMRRMMAEVPTADVIITNPVRYAVALRYDAREMSAPRVIAKGARLVAERIRQLAAENGVPIVERPELARTLYRSIEVGQSIPENLFRAVAEVLAFVYQIDRRAAKARERAAMRLDMAEAG